MHAHNLDAAGWNVQQNGKVAHQRVPLCVKVGHGHGEGEVQLHLVDRAEVVNLLRGDGAALQHEVEGVAPRVRVGRTPVRKRWQALQRRHLLPLLHHAQSEVVVVVVDEQQHLLARVARVEADARVVGHGVGDVEAVHALRLQNKRVLPKEEPLGAAVVKRAERKVRALHNRFVEHALQLDGPNAAEATVAVNVLKRQLPQRHAVAVERPVGAQRRAPRVVVHEARVLLARHHTRAKARERAVLVVRKQLRQGVAPGLALAGKDARCAKVEAGARLDAVPRDAAVKLLRRVVALRRVHCHPDALQPAVAVVEVRKVRVNDVHFHVLRAGQAVAPVPPHAAQPLGQVGRAAHGEKVLVARLAAVRDLRDNHAHAPVPVAKDGAARRARAVDAAGCHGAAPERRRARRRSRAAQHVRRHKREARVQRRVEEVWTHANVRVGNHGVVQLKGRALVDGRDANVRRLPRGEAVQRNAPARLRQHKCAREHGMRLVVHNAQVAVSGAARVRAHDKAHVLAAAHDVALQLDGERVCVDERVRADPVCCLVRAAVVAHEQVAANGGTHRRVVQLNAVTEGAVDHVVLQGNAVRPFADNGVVVAVGEGGKVQLVQRLVSLRVAVVVHVQDARVLHLALSTVVQLNPADGALANPQALVKLHVHHHNVRAVRAAALARALRALKPHVAVQLAHRRAQLHIRARASRHAACKVPVLQRGGQRHLHAVCHSINLHRLVLVRVVLRARNDNAVARPPVNGVQQLQRRVPGLGRLRQPRPRHLRRPAVQLERAKHSQHLVAEEPRVVHNERRGRALPVEADHSLVGEGAAGRANRQGAPHLNCVCLKQPVRVIEELNLADNLQVVQLGRVHVHDHVHAAVDDDAVAGLRVRRHALARRVPVAKAAVRGLALARHAAPLGQVRPVRRVVQRLCGEEVVARARCALDGGGGQHVRAARANLALHSVVNAGRGQDHVPVLAVVVNLARAKGIRDREVCDERGGGPLGAVCIHDVKGPAVVNVRPDQLQVLLHVLQVLGLGVADAHGAEVNHADQRGEVRALVHNRDRVAVVLLWPEGNRVVGCVGQVVLRKLHGHKVELVRGDAVNLQPAHAHAVVAHDAVVVRAVPAVAHARVVVEGVVGRRSAVDKPGQAAVQVVEDLLERHGPLDKALRVNEAQAVQAERVPALLVVRVRAAARTPGNRAAVQVADKGGAGHVEELVLRHHERGDALRLRRALHRVDKQAVDNVRVVLPVLNLLKLLPKHLLVGVANKLAVDVVQVAVELAKDAVVAVVEARKVVKVLRPGPGAGVARVHVGEVHGVDAQPVHAVGVRRVVAELNHVLVDGADGRGEGRAVRVARELKPVAVVGAASSDVVAPQVLGRRHPEGGRLCVALQHDKQLEGEDAQVGLNHVKRLVAVLHKERVPVHVVRHVVLHERAVRAMHRHRALERVVDGV